MTHAKSRRRTRLPAAIAGNCASAVRVWTLHEAWDVMVLTSISFRAQAHKRSELLSAVDALVQRMRVLPGCFRSRVLVDAEDESAFTILSEWKDPETAEAFLSTREAQIFRGIRILTRDEPLIVFDDIHTRVTRRLRGDASV